MQAWQVWLTVAAVVIVVLPFVLMAVFHGPERADSRGRRIDRTWRAARRW